MRRETLDKLLDSREKKAIENFSKWLEINGYLQEINFFSMDYDIVSAKEVVREYLEFAETED